jgi:hypothetical protein
LAASRERVSSCERVTADFGFEHFGILVAKDRKGFLLF